MRKMVFISGLPRSGSTLLCNILNQNPAFTVTATSGLSDLLRTIRDAWDVIPSIKSNGDVDKKADVMTAVIAAMRQGDVVFDKSRGWPDLLETMSWLFGEPKLIACVRDIPSILASFERLYRRSLAEGWRYPVPQQAFATVKDRCAYWASAQGDVGGPYNLLKESLIRGNGPRMLFVEYDGLNVQTAKTLRSIYNFIEEPFFPHDLTTLEQTVWENDHIWGIPGLHDIRPGLDPSSTDWKKTIGSIGSEYANGEFWRKT